MIFLSILMQEHLNLIFSPCPVEEGMGAWQLSKVSPPQPFGGA